MTDQPPTEQQLDEITAIAARATDDPFYVSDCEGSLQVWREKALTHVRRDESGEIDMYSFPSTYKVTDQIIELDLSTWDLGEDATDDQQRQDIHDLVEARAALPVLLDTIRRQSAELAAVHAFLDGQELAARAFELPTPAWVEAVRAASVPPAAPLPASQPSSVSESAQIPTGASEGRLGDLPSTEDLASADNPTPLRWGLNDALWGDGGSVIVMLSGPDREAYWLELDPERAAVLREDLAGPAEDPAPAETLIGSITIRSESVQLDNGECLRDLAVGDSVELRPDTGDEGLWIVAAFHGDYQEQITLQYAEVVDDCGNDPVIACKFSGTRHAHPVDLDGKVRPRPTP